MAPVPPSLSSLHAHSIFVPSNTSSKGDNEKWEILDGPYDLSVPLKKQRIVTRDKDIIVAHGNEIRMASLAGDGWDVIDGSIGTYRTLASPQLGFEVQSMVVNPNGRLLAVVGKSQVTVVALPSNGVLGAGTGHLQVKAFPIDEFTFTSSSSLAISKVLWHPWGEGGNSLWILTSDGKLREYDVLNPDDPTQTFFFLPETASSRMSALDPSALYATSFAFSPAIHSATPTDWSAAMVHVLCANGDIYLMRPILPLHAAVPVTWLQCLRVHAERAGGQQKQWVEAVWKIVSAEDDRKKVQGSTPPRRSSGAGPGSPRGAGAETPSGTVKIHPPHLTSSGGPAPGQRPSLARQGPVKYDPVPQEVGEAELDEDVACDLIIAQAGEEGETMVAIAWSGGKVDLGLVVDQPKPRWVNPREKAVKDVTLMIVESVLLPLPSGDLEAIAANAPVLYVDPIHGDTIHVQHNFGVDSISVQPWICALDEDGELPMSDITRIVQTSSSNPIIGSLVFCNIAFGYGLVALASTYQLAAIELDFRVAQGHSGDQSTSVKDDARAMVDASSLLSAKPLKHEQLIKNVHAGEASYVALARKASSAPITAVSSDFLRQVGDIVTKIQSRIHAIRQASQAIENHLDLCAKEFSRQIRLVKQCRDGVDSLEDHKAPARIERMVDRQVDLAERLDRVLGAIAAEYGPEVGEAEQKWFDELEKLKLGVKGSSIQAGMVQRAQVAREQLKSLKMPRPRGEASRPTGDTQDASERKDKLRPLEEALTQRGEEIQRLTKKIEELGVRVKVDKKEERKGKAKTPKPARIGLSSLTEDEGDRDTQDAPSAQETQDEGADESADEGDAEGYL